MRPLRLLLLTSDYAPGNWSGVGVAVAGQAEALTQIGHEVHVAVADDLSQRPSAASANDPGPRVYALGRRRFPLDPSVLDAVHLHSLRLAPIALELQRRFGLPLVTTVHGYVDRELPDQEMPGTGDSSTGDSGAGGDLRPWITLQRQVLKASDRVVVLSPSEAKLAAELDLPPHRLCTVGNGVEERWGSSGPRPESVAGPIVFAGRFACSKGIGLAGRLARRLIRDHGATVVFAGGHGDEMGDRAVRGLTRLGRGFESTGWLPRPRLRALYRRAALVVVPSRYEPFGLTALEALTSGTPVLASDVGGLRQTVPRSGRLASRHVDDWAAAALALLRDPQRCRALVARAQQGLGGFTWRRVAARLADEVYLPLVSSGKGWR